MDKDLRNKMIEKARENGAKFGKKAELDFGAGAEWMYDQLVKNCSILDVVCSYFDKTDAPHCEMCITCKYLSLKTGDCMNIDKLDYDTDGGNCKFWKQR